MSTSIEWGKKHGLSYEDLWKSPHTRIEHLIGKDIVYFHTLFWPAVLQATQHSLPSKVHVHGMLTVNGEKMSKSRGTFINAAVFAQHIDPQALRYYYACKYDNATGDLDLSFEDFVARINGELVNKHANLFSRMSQFMAQKLDNTLGTLPFKPAQAQEASSGDGSCLDQAQKVVACCKRIEKHYQERAFSHVIRELSAIADIGNEWMQAQKPWDQLKTSPEEARTTCTFAANVCHALAMYLWPIVPRFAEACMRSLGSTITHMDATTLFQEQQRPLGTFERLFSRIEDTAVQAVITASKPASAPAKTLQTPLKPSITYDDFARTDIRVGTVVSAENIAKSQKLLRLMIDIGEEKPRQIVAGLAQCYNPTQLVGTQVLVVANLQPAKIMGVESHGMVLAGGEPPQLAVARIDQKLAEGQVVR
jgi:methionyl-tRNA synthetase